jgi:hypothetical protein
MHTLKADGPFAQGYNCACCTGSRARTSKDPTADSEEEEQVPIGNVDMRFAGRLPDGGIYMPHPAAQAGQQAQKTSKGSSTRKSSPPRRAPAAAQAPQQQQDASSHQAPAPTQSQQAPAPARAQAPAYHAPAHAQDDVSAPARSQDKPAPAQVVRPAPAQDQEHDNDYAQAAEPVFDEEPLDGTYGVPAASSEADAQGSSPSEAQGSSPSEAEEADPERDAFDAAMGTNSVFHNYRKSSEFMQLKYRSSMYAVGHVARHAMKSQRKYSKPCMRKYQAHMA